MKSNFCSELLLCGNCVTIVNDKGKIFKMNLPLLRDKIENLDFDIFITFCTISIDEANKQNGTNFKNKYQLFRAYKSNKIDIMSILDKYFEKYMIGFKYVDDSLYWGEYIVNKEIFETFCNYCAIAAGVKSIKDLDLVITDDMDEFEKRRIMAERKIPATKNKGEKHGKETSMSLILTGVCSEFSYTYKELLDMTIYSIYYMYSQLGAIMGYEIGNIAAGNGLLKKNTKHKHWAQ